MSFFMQLNIPINRMSPIKATALGLLARRKNVSVLVDATGSSDKRIAKLALRNMWARGAKLTDTQTLLRVE